MFDFLKKKKKDAARVEPAAGDKNSPTPAEAEATPAAPAAPQPAPEKPVEKKALKEEKKIDKKAAKRGREENLALDWEVCRLSLIEQSEKKAWMTAKLLGGVCVALVAAIVLMMPLKQTEPYVIQLDKATGMATVLSIANTSDIPVSELMDKYWLKEYVLARESYDYRTLEQDYYLTRELSMPNVFEPYASQFGQRKDSLEMRLKDSKRITVELLSLVPNGNGVATVRFVKTTKDTTTGTEEARSVWTARIGYEYMPTFKADEAHRLMNPFGFKVTTYRVDPEFN